MASTCKECNQPLASVDFTAGYYYVCLNWQCPLYRERQEIQCKLVIAVRKPPGEYKDWETYQRFRQCLKENYYTLRALDFRPSFCKRFQSNKQTKRILTLIKHGLPREYITKTLLGDKEANGFTNVD